MKKIFLVLFLCTVAKLNFGQGTLTALNLPDFVQPTPEVSNLLKADNLSVGLNTGSPNINIPICDIAVNGIKIPIGLSYNCTGIKTDEYSSMVGMGWNCSSGGVVSRTILGRPDESRDAFHPSNFTPLSFNVTNAALLEFLKTNGDVESDIFSFSFLNYSGKFILDSSTLNVIPLSNYNVIIKVISNNFLNGFEIITPDGAKFTFSDAEVSQNRNPQGDACPKSYDNSTKKTSWYLTKATAPNRRSYISFTYLTANITYEQSISQQISKVTSSESHAIVENGINGNCPTGPACTVGSVTFYTCVPRQTVTAKFISKIESSAGDKAEFIYSGTEREDLYGGKRLSKIKITARNGVVIKLVTFYGSYPSVSGTANYATRNNRLFLDSIAINNPITEANEYSYRFGYIDKGGLCKRLTFMQDFYGYYNGKSNSCLIPKLDSGDVNFSIYSSGTGTGSVTFADRSVDTAYSIKGLLNKIEYPTGGYDSIKYMANKYIQSGQMKLAGGFSVKGIESYSMGQKAMEKSYLYLDSINGNSSLFMLNSSLKFSENLTKKTDGYSCAPGLGYVGYSCCAGPACGFANVSSNIINPVTLTGGQHVYYNNVIEKIVSSTNNGYTEHHYIYIGGGSLYASDMMGNRVIGTPLHVVPDILTGEDKTKMYSYDSVSNTYKLIKFTENFFRYGSFKDYFNYVIKQNWAAAWMSTPPSDCEFEPFDVGRYGIIKYYVFTDSVKETSYDKSNTARQTKIVFTYHDSLYTFPVKQTTYTSDGSKLETVKKYPPDVYGAALMTYRNIIAPVLEEKSYRNDTLLSTVTNTYTDWNSDSSLIVLQQTEYKEQTNSMPGHINFIGYDTLGNVLELAKDSGVHKVYVWGYNRQLPLAVVTNASANEVYCNSFEETGGTADANAKTGDSSYNGNFYVGFTLPNGKTYTITYWAWNGSAWIFNEQSYTGPVTLTGTKIDEVRIYPAGAQMISFTYKPLQGISSQCDERNQVSYYEYDAFGRLKLIRDADRKILKVFDYKYNQ